MTQPRLGFLIHDIARLLREDFTQRAQSLHLTQAQSRVLLLLSVMEGCSQTALAQALNVRPITLGRVIDRLEAAGLVERRAHPGDRRALELHLSPRSKATMSRLFALARGTAERALHGLGTAEREQLFTLLEHVKRNLSEQAHAAA